MTVSVIVRQNRCRRKQKPKKRGCDKPACHRVLRKYTAGKEGHNKQRKAGYRDLGDKIAKQHPEKAGKSPKPFKAGVQHGKHIFFCHIVPRHANFPPFIYKMRSKQLSGKSLCVINITPAPASAMARSFFASKRLVSSSIEDVISSAIKNEGVL